MFFEIFSSATKYVYLFYNFLIKLPVWWTVSNKTSKFFMLKVWEWNKLSHLQVITSFSKIIKFYGLAILNNCNKYRMFIKLITLHAKFENSKVSKSMNSCVVAFLVVHNEDACTWLKVEWFSASNVFLTITVTILFC